MKKGKIKKFINGSISILLSFIMSGVLSLSAMMVEISRYQDAKKQLEESSIVSALSVLASYDSSLAERFGIYGVNSEGIVDDTFFNYLMFNSDGEKTGTYASENISQLYYIDSATFELKYDLASYEVLKRQILEYEKYRLPMNWINDSFDIDKMLKKLKENLIDMVPGLEEFLEIANSIAGIAEAIKSLYGLAKDVQQIQLTIHAGKADDWKEMANNWLGEGWEAVEEFFTGEEWPSHDPSYKVAYEAFKQAISDKVSYMKENPSPPDPGPQPTADVNGLKKEYENVETELTTVLNILSMIKRATELGYCNNVGIVEPEKDISDILDDTVTMSVLEQIGLGKDSSRKKFFQILATYIGKYAGEEFVQENYRLTDLDGITREIASMVSVLERDKIDKFEAYEVANNEYVTWVRAKEALDEYKEKIGSYDTEITNQKTSLITVIGILLKELGDYKGSIVKVSGALDGASESLKTIQKMQNGDTSEDKDEKPDVFSEIKALFLTSEEAKADAGREFLDAQRNQLENLNLDNINASYVFSDEFNTGRLLDEDNSYYMSKTQVAAWSAKLVAFNILEEMDQLIDIFKAMYELVQLVQPFPNDHNWDCVVELNEATTSILPSNIEGGLGTREELNQNDIDSITSMLDDVKENVGTAYYDDINSLYPENRIEDGELELELTEKITCISSDLNSIMKSSAMGMLNQTTFPLISTIITLVKVVPKLICLIQNFIYVSQHMEAAMELIVASLGEGLLISQYAVEKFPNRISDKNGDKQNKEIDGYKGYYRTYFPDKDAAIQTFSGAQVEYIIGGSTSEMENQVSTFWSIFLIRAINNMVAILADESVLELISSCNVFAPLVYILWVYLESNIDMNLLISGAEVKLIKFEIILSPETLVNNIDSLKEAFKKIDVEKEIENELSYAAMKVDLIKQQMFETKGLFDMDYQKYLWFFLYFMPNSTKVMRIADLIQMEMRYGNFANGTNFMLENMHTYVRCEASGRFNSILPVISLKNNTLNGRGIKVNTVKYVGY